MVSKQYVILVDDNDEQTGVAEKMDAHRKGLLHRAFSVFIMNSQGQMLLQQRAFTKYHSGGLWTNACCSHPMPGEKILDAAHRRIQEEMGFDCDLKYVYNFTYKVKLDNELTEHELDHVLVGIYDGPVKPSPEEVCHYRYVNIDELEKEMLKAPDTFTTWFRITYSDARKYLSNMMDNTYQ